MNKLVLFIIVILVVATGGYFLLRGSYQAPSPVVMPTVTPEKQTEQPTSTTVEVPVKAKEVTVIGTEFSFSPASINVKAGERVKITFKNTGGAPHNLILEGLGIETKTISGGQTDVVEFTAPSSGTYNFFCSIPGHRASGMEGALKVE